MYFSGVKLLADDAKLYVNTISNYQCIFCGHILLQILQCLHGKARAMPCDRSICLKTQKNAIYSTEPHLVIQGNTGSYNQKEVLKFSRLLS